MLKKSPRSGYNSKKADKSFKFLEDGKKVRVFRSDGEMIDVG